MEENLDDEDDYHLARKMKSKDRRVDRWMDG